MTQAIPPIPSYDEVQAGLVKGDVSSFLKNTHDSRYSEKLLSVFSNNIKELEKSKEEAAPLIEAVILNLPESKRAAPEVKALISFLKTTNHFHKQQVLEHLFIEAAQIGNDLLVDEILHLGVKLNFNAVDKNMTTALHWACINGHLNVVQVLLKAGASVNRNAVNSEGKTPLHIACCEGRNGIAIALLKAGVSTHILDNHGASPLHDVVHMKNEALLQAFYEAKADFNQKNTDSYTPLCYLLIGPASKDDDALVKSLIAKGADRDLAQEILDRKFLAHVMGFIGVLDNIKLEGAIATFSMQKLLDLLTSFKKSNDQLKKVPEDSLSRFLNAIEHPYRKREFNRLNPSKFMQNQIDGIIQKLNSGQPVVILAGPHGHAINILLEQDPITENIIITICNRGEGAEAVGGGEVLAGVRFVMPKDKVNQALIGDLLYVYPNAKGFQDMVASNLGAIQLSQLGFTQQMQKGGNCSWTSSKTVFLAFLLNHGIDEDTAQEIYKSFTEFAREQAILYYKGRNNPYASKVLIADVEKKQKERTIHRQRISSFNLAELNHAIDSGKIQSLMQESVDRKFAARLLPLLASNLADFTENEEKIAPLVAKVMINLPAAKRNSPHVETLFNFLKGTAYFKNPKTQEMLLRDAVKRGNDKMTLELSKKESYINIDATDENGATALHWACLGENKKIIQILLTAGASLKIQDARGDTPFHLACSNGNQESAKLLMGAGVDINAANIDGLTPLRLACANKEKGIVVLLLEQTSIKVDAQDQGKLTPFLFCCLNNNMELAEILLQGKADINAQDAEEMTALHWACAQQKKEIVEWLIQNKSIKVDLQNRIGQTPLHLACESQNLPLIKILLKKASTEVKDSKGKTPLLSACANGDLEMVSILLGKADVNAKDNEGKTALHHACIRGNRKLIELLLQRKDIKLYEIDDKGYIPHDYLIARKDFQETNDPVERLLKKREADETLP